MSDPSPAPELTIIVAYSTLLTSAVVTAIVLIMILITTWKIEPLRSIQSRFEVDKMDLDLERTHPFPVLFGVVLWSIILVILIAGLIWQIWQLGFAISDDKILNEANGNLIRSRLILLTALTATLGAVVALPVTLRRLRLTRKQTWAAEETIFNDKVAEALRDLYAQRQVTLFVDGKHLDVWEDDIVRRTTAIDRLERLVSERPNEVSSVASVLSVYVRELSKAEKPITVDEGNIEVDWRETLKDVEKRFDMERAVQTLGRLRQYDEKLVIDLSHANLQKMNLRRLNFAKSRLIATHMQGASLYGTKMQDADLVRTQLQGADLKLAQFQGAYLPRAQFDRITRFESAIFRGSAVTDLDLSTIMLTQGQVDQMFGDDSVKLPDGIDPPKRFLKSYKNYDDFGEAWSAWQKEIGFDPKDASTWEEP